MRLLLSHFRQNSLLYDVILLRVAVVASFCHLCVRTGNLINYRSDNPVQTATRVLVTLPLYAFLALCNQRITFCWANKARPHWNNSECQIEKQVDGDGSCEPPDSLLELKARKKISGNDWATQENEEMRHRMSWFQFISLDDASRFGMCPAILSCASGTSWTFSSLTVRTYHIWVSLLDYKTLRQSPQ